jgi:hypothetical protein
MAHFTDDAKWLARTGRTVVLMTAIGRSFAQSPPLTADRPWHSGDEQQIMRDARRFHPPVFRTSYGFRIFRILELALYHSLGKLPEPEFTMNFSDQSKI